MSPIRRRNLQTAQGMVEFALVLPILLLIVLGIFAFGHLFFSYSSVVSASREAARWGSAVGVSDSMRPRYQDCDAIRAQAVRVGSVAGVDAKDLDLTNPDDFGIYIDFDDGPGTTHHDPCVQGGTGPLEVGYTTRINIEVRVQYRSIVPIATLPSFPLRATTSRTIIRGLPVGEAPTAAPSCPTTAIALEFVPIQDTPLEPPYWPKVGQPFTVRVRVTSSDLTSPTGTVDISDELGHKCTVPATSANPGEMCATPLVPEGYPEYDVVHTITAHYYPNPACSQSGGYLASDSLNNQFKIIMADAFVEILSDLKPDTWPGETVLIPIKVSAAPPSLGVPPPTGMVTVSDLTGWSGQFGPINSIDGTLTIPVNPEVTTSYVVEYEGDFNYNQSPPSAPKEHVIKKVAPPDCPNWDGNIDMSVANSFQFNIINPATGIDRAVTGVDVSWQGPTTVLNLIGFGPNSAACTGKDKYCLFKPAKAVNPPSTNLISTSSGWNTIYSGLNMGTSKFMLFNFNPPKSGFASGHYQFDIHFGTDCTVSIPVDR